MNALPAKQAPYRAFELFNMASFVVGAEAVDVINVAVTLKDARGRALSQPGVADVWLASDAAGSVITPTVPTSTLAIGTNGHILAVLVTNKMLRISSDATGKFDINIPQTAAPVTYYLAVLMPDGSLAVSSAITFA